MSYEIPIVSILVRNNNFMMKPDYLKYIQSYDSWVPVFYTSIDFFPLKPLVWWNWLDSVTIYVSWLIWGTWISMHFLCPPKYIWHGFSGLNLLHSANKKYILVAVAWVNLIQSLYFYYEITTYMFSLFICKWRHTFILKYHWLISEWTKNRKG